MAHDETGGTLPPRMPLIADEDLSPAQREAMAELVSGPRGRVRGPFVPMLRSPEFMRRAQKLGEYLRFDSALPPRVSEMIILVTARQWSQDFEFHVHAPIALERGLDPSAVEDISFGRVPAKLADDERVAYDFCTTVQETHQADDAVYQQMTQAFGEKGVIDALGIIGYYTMLAMILNVSRTPLPDGAATLPALS